MWILNMSHCWAFGTHVKYQGKLNVIHFPFSKGLWSWSLNYVANASSLATCRGWYWFDIDDGILQSMYDSASRRHWGKAIAAIECYSQTVALGNLSVYSMELDSLSKARCCLLWPTMVTYLSALLSNGWSRLLALCVRKCFPDWQECQSVPAHPLGSPHQKLGHGFLWTISFSKSAGGSLESGSYPSGYFSLACGLDGCTLRILSISLRKILMLSNRTIDLPLICLRAVVL